MCVCVCVCVRWCVCACVSVFVSSLRVSVVVSLLSLSLSLSLSLFLSVFPLSLSDIRYCTYKFTRRTLYCMKHCCIRLHWSFSLHSFLPLPPRHTHKTKTHTTDDKILVDQHQTKYIQVYTGSNSYQYKF